MPSVAENLDLIVITHTHADGTLVVGDPRPHQEALKGAGFRYSRNVGWYLRGSRDRRAQTARIEQAAAGLRAAGFTVETEVDNEARSIVEREADRVDRNAGRVEGLAAKAERLNEQADATWTRAREMADLIPLGQPVLVDHYSAKGHLRHLDKVNRTYGKAFETTKEATEAARKAAAAAANQAHHLDTGTILRRIEMLEGERRDITRRLGRYPDNGTPERSAYREQIAAVDGTVAEDVAYWRMQIVESGAKLWGPGDFVKGDRVSTPHNGTVVRVNKKSLTVEWDLMPNIRQTVPYHKVTGKIEGTDR